MKRTLSRGLFAAVLAITVLCTTALASGFDKLYTYDGRFDDVSSDSWYYTNVTAAYESGLFSGMSDSAFGPDVSLTLAQSVTLASRIHSLYYEHSADFTAGSDEDWYSPYYDYAVDNGLIDAVFYPVSSIQDTATRYQMAEIFARVLPDSCYAQINTVESGAIPDVSAESAYAASVYKLYRAGILIGDESSRYNGDTSVKRSEACAIVTRLTGLAERLSVSLTNPDKSYSQYATVTCGSGSVSIGMSTDELTAVLGTPDETLSAILGYEWYVYGSGDYKDFIMAGVYGDKIVAIYSAGSEFTYLSYGAGDASFDPDEIPAKQDGVKISVYSDSNDNGSVFSVYLVSQSLTAPKSHTDETLSDESRAMFHMVNAFRVWHDEDILKWDGDAAEAAADHSQEMADHDYMSHDSLNGASFDVRLGMYVSKFRVCAENLAAGASSSASAMNALVNSAGHRSNLLSSDVDHLGVGVGYNSSSTYDYYYTQDFWA